MREQIISLIVAEENVGKIYKSSKILLDELLKKEVLELELNQAIKNYDPYIKIKLIADGNNGSSKKIAEIINQKFF